MSRPNNPQAQFAARPLPGQIPEQDPQAWNGVPARPQQHQPQSAPAAHPGYAQPYAYPQPDAPPAGAYAQNGQPPRYPQQQAMPPDPFAGTQYAAQAGVQQSRQPQPVYAPPQHDPFAQMPQAPAPQAYGNQQQWPAAAPVQDAGAYDLSAYGAAGGPADGFDMALHAPQHRGGQWAGHDPYAAEPSFDPALYAAPQQHGGTVEQTYAEEDIYEVEPPRSRGRKFAMVLLGAVIAGGGLTYAYSALLGTPGDGTPPVVKGAEGPFKVKPSDPGGKQFAHADSKIMGRLGEGGESPAASDTDVSGTRRVPVLTVGRDGSIQPPAGEAAAPQGTTISVPGMVIGGLGGPKPRDTAEARPAAEPPASPPAKITTASADADPVVVSPPSAMQQAEAAVIGSREKKTSATDVPSFDTADVPAAQSEPAKKAPAAKKAVVAAVAAPAAAGPAATGAGWVTVLASVPASDKSRMDALKQFADMQQKYGALLQNKTPDIQEANLGEKGTYHRLMVGPPGSREAASELCTQLKAQGYPSCWVTAY